MATRRTAAIVGTVLTALAVTTAASAQSVGTFRWQLRPFCNVVSVAVTQVGAIYRLEGTDDQCGGGTDSASVTGTAFQNPDGTIGFGLNIVTSPGGTPVHVDAAITLATLSGTWRDSTGANGLFVLTPGASTGGSPRPLPSPGVPTAVQLRADGGLLATGAEGIGVIPASGDGVRMMWYPGKAAFRAGQSQRENWDDGNVGFGSAAFGDGTTASGDRSMASGESTRASGTNSTAMGEGATASGQESTATGSGTTASGDQSTAMGDNTMASGEDSTAMGNATSASGREATAMGEETSASGTASTAMGISTTASGTGSIAMGSDTTASGVVATTVGNGTRAGGDHSFAGGLDAQAAGRNAFSFGFETFASFENSVALGRRAVSAGAGSFTFADMSSTGQFVSQGPNQFNVRAAGGVGFFSNPDATLGVVLPPGGNQFTSVSDVNAKHAFETLDHDDVLTRLAVMPVVKWSYKGQTQRHLGPMAQDFHAAFGLGNDPLRLGPLDVSGVALAGVRALEARSRAQADEITMLRAELARVTALVEALAVNPR